RLLVRSPAYGRGNGETSLWDLVGAGNSDWLRLLTWWALGVVPRSPVPRCQVVGLERRAVPEARSAAGTVRRPAQDGPLDRRETEVERATQVPEVHGQAEARDRAGVASRRPLGRGALPRARDRREPAAQVARAGAGGGGGAVRVGAGTDAAG